MWMFSVSLGALTRHVSRANGIRKSMFSWCGGMRVLRLGGKRKDLTQYSSVGVFQLRREALKERAEVEVSWIFKVNQ